MKAVLISLLLNWISGQNFSPMDLDGDWKFAGMYCGGELVEFKGFVGELKIRGNTLVEQRRTTLFKCETRSVFDFKVEGDRMYAAEQSLDCSSRGEDVPNCWHVFFEDEKARMLSCEEAAPKARIYEINVSGDVLKRRYRAGGVTCIEAFLR